MKPREDRSLVRGHSAPTRQGFKMQLNFGLGVSPQCNSSPMNRNKNLFATPPQKKLISENGSLNMNKIPKPY
jgi:hypothetical protein